MCSRRSICSMVEMFRLLLVVGRTFFACSSERRFPLIELIKDFPSIILSMISVRHDFSGRTVNEPKIILNHISKAFARKAETGLLRARRACRAVLKDVTLEVESGECVCVIGKNGSGKTTLMRILSTLVQPDNGQARICGFDVVKQGREVRRRIGVMLNAGDTGFQPRTSGLTNLEWYAALYSIPQKEAHRRIQRWLQDLQLADRGSDQIQSYSSGMRRRLALARALLSDPEILLLDEPTLGVDPWTMEQIHKQLRSYVMSGKTILCTTNSLTETRALARRVFRLENGVLSESAIKEELSC